jgi:hypothetical protein
VIDAQEICGEKLCQGRFIWNGGLDVNRDNQLSFAKIKPAKLGLL